MKVGKECVVSIHYRLTDEAGGLLDSSEGKAPLTCMYMEGPR